MTPQLYMTNRGLLDGVVATSGIFDYLGLYQNQVDLTKGFDPTLLVEADFSGYARFHFGGSGWSAPFIDSDGNGAVTHDEITFEKSGATENAEIWGFFFMLTDGTTIILAQEFAAAPYPMVADGDLIRLTPKYAASNPIFP